MTGPTSVLLVFRATVAPRTMVQATGGAAEMRGVADDERWKFAVRRGHIARVGRCGRRDAGKHGRRE